MPFQHKRIHKHTNFSIPCRKQVFRRTLVDGTQRYNDNRPERERTKEVEAAGEEMDEESF